MASNFLDQWKKAGRKINHSGFDVSGKRVWSAPAGLMTVPFMMETNPNERFEIDVQGLMRTQTMNTAAFADGREVVSCFFVPYSQLWHNFNSFVSQKDDRHSSTQKSMMFVPQVSLKDLYVVYLNMYTTFRLLQFMKKGEQVTGYNFLHSGTYRESFTELEFTYDADVSNLENLEANVKSRFGFTNWNLQYVCDMHGIPYIHNFERALQFFGLGTPYFVKGLWEDRFVEELASDTTLEAMFEAAEVAHNLTLQEITVNSGANKSFFVDKYVNIFRPAAYQHIFYDVFRNKFFDELPFYQSTLDGAEVVRYIDTFNFDDIECKDFATSLLAVPASESIYGSLCTFDAARFLNLFEMHYRQYKHDLFTSAMNATQFGAVSSVSFDGTAEITFDQNGQFILGSKDGKLQKANVNYSEVLSHTEALADYGSFYYPDYADPSSGDPLVFGENTGMQDAVADFSLVNNKTNVVSGFSLQDLASKIKLPTLFDVLQLRRAELLQQWKQNALRAGNMVDDNFKQHYGVAPYYEDDNNVKFLGSFECPLEAKPITATASTGSDNNGQVGDLAAIGVGAVKGSKIRFECRDFGVVMCVAYFLPDVFYTSNGVDQENTLVEPFDFYSEEFENIGFESLPYWVQSIGLNKLADGNIGFVPPFTRYKTNWDKVFGEFGSITIGGYHVQDEGERLDYGLVVSGTMRPWTLQREDVGSEIINGVAVRSKSNFYVDPRVTDPLFGLEYDGRQIDDPMHFFFNFDFKALRPMSVLGLPIFG